MAVAQIHVSNEPSQPRSVYKSRNMRTTQVYALSTNCPKYKHALSTKLIQLQICSKYTYALCSTVKYAHKHTWEHHNLTTATTVYVLWAKRPKLNAKLGRAGSAWGA